MAVRHTLERWFVGEPGSDEPASDSMPMLPSSAGMDLARLGEAADAIRSHLEAQAREHHEVLNVLASLSEPLASLPRIASQQDRLGETLGQALLHARQRDAGIDATLGRIADGLSQQTEVTGLIQQQLDLNLQAANGVAEGTTRLTEAVTELASSNQQGTEFLSRLVEQTRTLTEERGRAHRSMRMLLIAAVSLGFVAVALAAIAVVLALASKG